MKTQLKPECIIIRVNYYRFHGFWHECDYIPYIEHLNYSFNPVAGIYNKIENLTDKTDKSQIINFIDNITMDKDIIVNFFNEHLEKIKTLDEKSDVKMYDFFKLNYKSKLLFNDRFHPSNVFMYELFRQLVKIIANLDLPHEDNDFLNKLKSREMTHWTIPILPIVKKILELEFDDNTVFSNQIHPMTHVMDVYDYYYIRLDSNNFNKFLSSTSVPAPVPAPAPAPVPAPAPAPAPALIPSSIHMRNHQFYMFRKKISFSSSIKPMNWAPPRM
jgi:hypothetical protein